MSIVPGFRYVAWLTALCVAGFFAFGAFRFGQMAEPEQTDGAAALFFFFLALGSQAGLIAAPWSLSQHWPVRIVVGAFMAPAALFLGVAAWEGAERFMGGTPLSPIAWAMYLVSTLVYALAYIELVWRGVRRERSL